MSEYSTNQDKVDRALQLVGCNRGEGEGRLESATHRPQATAYTDHWPRASPGPWGGPHHPSGLRCLRKAGSQT